MGTINKLIENAKAAIPDLDELRALNRNLRDSGCSFHDAIRGGKLLEEINLLNISLDELANYNAIAKRISDEKGAQTFDAAMRLVSMEKKTKKPYEILIKEFEALSSRIDAEKGSMDALIIEHKDLEQKISSIKDVFSAQGLTWKEGLTIVKNVKDLKSEVELLTNTLDAFQFDVEEAEKKIADVENKRGQLKASINAFEKANIELRKEYTFYSSWMENEAPQIWKRQIELEDNKKKLTNELGELQRENAATEEQKIQLQQRCAEISKNVKDLEFLKGALTKKCEDMVATAKSQKAAFDAAGQESLENAKERTKEIIKDAEVKRDRVLAGIRAEKEELNKQVEILKAETDLIKAARRPILNELSAARKKLEGDILPDG